MFISWQDKYIELHYVQGKMESFLTGASNSKQFLVNPCEKISAASIVGNDRVPHKELAYSAFSPLRSKENLFVDKSSRLVTQLMFSRKCI